MRKCCCCISVHIGAAILGVIGIAICLLELAVLVPFLFNIDEWNPIKDNYKYIEMQLEHLMKNKKDEVNWNDDEIKRILNYIRDCFWPSVLGAAVEAGVYALSCLLMIVGAVCQVRGLMIPYLILQMLVLIVFILIGIGFTVVAFFYNVIAGAVAGVVVLILSILLIYFWVAVQRAYIELGNNDYMYSPAPVKPSYNDGRGAYYPTSPQHFQMDERK